MANKSCLGSIIKGTFILCTCPISVPILIIQSKRRNELIRVIYDTDKPSRYKNASKQDLYNAAVLYATNGERIISDSSHLIYSTENPDVFFKRYDILLIRLHNNAIVERSYPRMFNHSQRKQYEQITSPAEKTELTNAMVNRYLLRVDRLKSDDAKQRKAIECRDVLESYYSFMTPESVEFCKLLFVQTYHI